MPAQPVGSAGRTGAVHAGDMVVELGKILVSGQFSADIAITFTNIAISTVLSVLLGFAAGAKTIGSRTETVVPRSSSLSTFISPPCSDTRLLTMDSPRPVPSWRP